MKHDGSKKVELRTKLDANLIELDNGKIYFFEKDPYERKYTLSSITVTGGGYTNYMAISDYNEQFYVSGNTVIYCGNPCTWNDFAMANGFCAYDLSTKQYSLVVEGYEYPYMLHAVNGGCIVENEGVWVLIEDGTLKKTNLPK